MSFASRGYTALIIIMIVSTTSALYARFSKICDNCLMLSSNEGLLTRYRDDQNVPIEDDDARTPASKTCSPGSEVSMNVPGCGLSVEVGSALRHSSQTSGHATANTKTMTVSKVGLARKTQSMHISDHGVLSTWCSREGRKWTASGKTSFLKGSCRTSFAWVPPRSGAWTAG